MIDLTVDVIFCNIFSCVNRQAKKDGRSYWILFDTCLLLSSCGQNYLICSPVLLVNKTLYLYIFLAKDISILFSFFICSDNLMVFIVGKKKSTETRCTGLLRHRKQEENDNINTLRSV